MFAKATPRETQRAAFAKAEATAENNRALLFAALKEHGPMTADETGHRVGLGPFEARPRMSQLHRRGLIEPTGDARPSDNGNPATVWRVV